MSAPATDSDDLTWLQNWYSSQCDEDWEHQYGVSIDNLDNPGWRVKIDLTGTSLEGRSAPRTKTEVTEEDWVHWWVEHDQFHGAGGAHNLGGIIQAFRTWVEATEKQAGQAGAS